MAGSGNYKICLLSAGIAGLATIDVDPSRAQYNSVPPSDHDQDGSPIFQGYDMVVWEFDQVTDTLTTQLRALEGEDVYIKTRDADHYTFSRYTAIFDQFVTTSKKGRRWLTGEAVFTKVESV